MTDAPRNSLLPIGATPEAVDPDLAPLLAEPFAQAWSEAPTALAATAVDARLRERVARSREAASGMVTVRQRRAARQVLADGVQQTLLYSAPAGRALRPGEPQRVRLLELAAGATLPAHALDAGRAGAHLECLVLGGEVQVDAEPLSLRDYRVVPAGHPTPVLRAREAALVFVRESDLHAAPGDAPFTVADAAAGWPAFAPGIRRRVLWQRDGQAAMLYHTDAGASVPLHTHGHDEECLMVQGELFLDDQLLQAGDYQLASAGTAHRLTETDTGAVLYAHGDLDLRFVG